MSGVSSISSSSPFPGKKPIKEEKKEEEKSAEKPVDLGGSVASVKEAKSDKQTPQGRRPSAAATSTAVPKPGFLNRMVKRVRTTSGKPMHAVTAEGVRRAGEITESREPEVSVARTSLGKRVYHFKGDILPWMQNIFEAGKRGDQYVVEQFNALIENSSHFTPEQKNKLLILVGALKKGKIAELDSEMEKEFRRPELSEDLSSPLLPDAELDALHREIAESIRKTVYEHIANLGKSIAEKGIAECKELSTEATKELEDFAEKISKEASDIEGAKRFEVIHEDEMWDPRKVTERPMAFTSTRTGEGALVVSSFRAAGPGSSSMIPRNRTRKTAYAANFFTTGVAIKAEGEKGEPLELMDGVTRSAITVEFDQEDKNERTAANLTLNRQVLDAKVKRNLEEKTWEELEGARDPKKPIILKLQTVNLLTTDRLRYLARQSSKFANLGKKFHEGLSGSPADDERSLALENLAAHKELNGQTVSYTVEDSKGSSMTIYVQYDLRYFNIPNNILQEKMPELLTSCSELEEANTESWNKLEEDIWSQLKELDDLIEMTSETGISSEEQLTFDEQQWLTSFNYACRNKVTLREEIMVKMMGKGSLKGTAQAFKEWQAVADDVANRIAKIRKSPSLSFAMKEMLHYLEMRENLRDLYLDTRELYMSGLWKNPRNMDNNRSALATRIIALGALVKDLQVHFGCRSGKDRTGLVDIELKLLLMEAFLSHRMPSYREEERMEDIVDHRETMTLESGNVQDIIRATMGASIGINTVGSAVKPLSETDPRGEQLVQTTEASQAGQSLARRPKTNLPVKPGYLEAQDTTIVVKHA